MENNEEKFKQVENKNVQENSNPNRTSSANTQPKPPPPSSAQRKPQALQKEEMTRNTPNKN